MSDIHVLIVDDEEALVRSLSYALRGEGMRISTAGSGETALELLAGRPPASISCCSTSVYRASMAWPRWTVYASFTHDFR